MLKHRGNDKQDILVNDLVAAKDLYETEKVKGLVEVDGGNINAKQDGK